MGLFAEAMLSACRTLARDCAHRSIALSWVEHLEHDLWRSVGDMEAAMRQRAPEAVRLPTATPERV